MLSKGNKTHDILRDSIYMKYPEQANLQHRNWTSDYLRPMSRDN